MDRTRLFPIILCMHKKYWTLWTIFCFVCCLIWKKKQQIANSFVWDRCMEPCDVWLVYFIVGNSVIAHWNQQRYAIHSVITSKSRQLVKRTLRTSISFAPTVDRAEPAPFPKYRPMNSTGTPTGTRLIIPPSLVKLWAERRGVVGWSRLQPWTRTNSIRPKCWWIGGFIWPTKEPCKGDRACTRILGPAPFRQLTRWIQ